MKFLVLFASLFSLNLLAADFVIDIKKLPKVYEPTIPEQIRKPAQAKALQQKMACPIIALIAQKKPTDFGDAPTMVAVMTGKQDSELSGVFTLDKYDIHLTAYPHEHTKGLFQMAIAVFPKGSTDQAERSINNMFLAAYDGKYDGYGPSGYPKKVATLFANSFSAAPSQVVGSHAFRKFLKANPNVTVSNFDGTYFRNLSEVDDAVKAALKAGAIKEGDLVAAGTLFNCGM
jgi:hypothetical protein